MPFAKPIASALVLACVLTPLAATAQTASAERAMPAKEGAPPDTKSERAMPTQTKEAAPAPAAAERAMPPKEK